MNLHDFVTFPVNASTILLHSRSSNIFRSIPIISENMSIFTCVFPSKGFNLTLAAAIYVLVVVGLHLAAPLLTFPRLVVLEPVEYILPLDLPVPPELGGDVLDLVR